MRILLCIALVWATSASAQAPAPPHLERHGAATQLVVDGNPFLVLGGELHNTVSSDLEAMKTIWPVLGRELHLNTVLVGIGWDWIEPGEGRFDFRIVDDAIRNARENNLRIVLLWFGSWKNGLSSFAPAWVKADQRRFPRAKIRDGKTVEILSAFSDANRDADARAFAALLRHVRETDPARRVVMVQVENEVGVLGDARDRSAAANAAFASAGAESEEAFQAAAYARYVNAVAAAGKREYALPMYVNAWIVQPQDKGPGDYPSGGPQAHNHAIWRANAPAIDLLCPDIYLPDFAGITAEYTRDGSALFVPESFGGAQGAANAFLAIGNHAAIGYSPFGIDEMRQGSGPFAAAYEMLGQLAPAILEAQAKGTIAAAALDKAHPNAELEVGGYGLHVTLTRSFRNPDLIPDSAGYALAIASGPDEFLLAGNGLQVSFTPKSPGPKLASLARQEAGRFEDGKWVTTRILGGDDSVLRYDFAKIVETGQSGSGVRLTGGIQKVKLYRYD